MLPENFSAFGFNSMAGAEGVDGGFAAAVSAGLAGGFAAAGVGAGPAAGV